MVVIAFSVIASLQELDLERMWIGFGQGRTLCWIPFHELVSQIGSQKYQGVHIFHAFTGCDVVSVFRGHGTPLDRLLRSVFYLHQTRGSWWSCIDKSGEATNVYRPTAKLDMFARKQRSYDAIPPTERM